MFSFAIVWKSPAAVALGAKKECRALPQAVVIMSNKTSIETADKRVATRRRNHILQVGVRTPRMSGRNSVSAFVRMLFITVEALMVQRVSVSARDAFRFLRLLSWRCVATCVPLSLQCACGLRVSRLAPAFSIDSCTFQCVSHAFGICPCSGMLSLLCNSSGLQRLLRCSKCFGISGVVISCEQELSVFVIVL